MYAWIWRKLPGPWPVKAARGARWLLAAVVAAAVHRRVPVARAAAAVQRRHGRRRRARARTAAHRDAARPRAGARAATGAARGAGVGDDGRVSARILVVDNYDSFVFNLVQYLAQLGAEVDVRRNDEVDARRGPRLRRRAALPRPGHARGRRRLPRDRCASSAACVPIFGVCLGHQAIGEAYGATVVPRAGAAARQDQPGAPRRRRRARGPARPVHRHALPLARDRPRHGARRARGHRAHRLRRDHGRAPPHAARSRACSSTRRACSPRAATGCSPTGSTVCGDPDAVAASVGLAPVVAR